ncbi:MAG: hypothetical protein QG575_1726 [Euryarchaeota archaeon]|nr:hypothetical protein [Euryarchaeota archaeon]
MALPPFTVFMALVDMPLTSMSRLFLADSVPRWPYFLLLTALG